jgi:hypothetical protein
MFEIQPNTATYDFSDRPTRNNHEIMLNQAFTLFYQARWDAFFEKLQGLILRREKTLFDLQVIAARQVRSRQEAGTQKIALDRICGTLAFTGDFDGSFHPLDDRIRDPWVGIAMAYRQNQPITPVELIQIRSCFFVKDGHHRISVAHALGMKEIEAKVTVWEINGRLPWESQSSVYTVPQTAS